MILILKCVRMALSEVALLNLLDLDQWSFLRRTKKKEYKSFSLFFPSSFSEEDWDFMVCPRAEGSCRLYSSLLEVRPRRGRSAVLLLHADFH